MANRKKSMTWREVSIRWRAQPNKKTAKEWLDSKLEDGTVSIEVVRKYASNGTGARCIDKEDQDYEPSLAAYCKEKVAGMRSQSYGEVGRVPPVHGEVREYKAVGRDDAVPCVRVPLHGVKVGKSGKVPVKFDTDKERIVVGG